jgi:hypothetical protein
VPVRRLSGCLSASGRWTRGRGPGGLLSRATTAAFRGGRFVHVFVRLVSVYTHPAAGARWVHPRAAAGRRQAPGQTITRLGRHQMTRARTAGADAAGAPRPTPSRKPGRAWPA